MMDHIKGILFDKDGTLFDFHVTWGAWAQSFFMDIARGDRAEAVQMAKRLGYDYDTKAFNKNSVIIAGTPDEVTAELVDAAPGWNADDLVAHVNKVAAAVPQAEPVPLIPLLESFRANGLKLGVATNDSEVPARAHLESAGITHLFDFISGFDSGYGSKPATGMQLGFCDQVDLAPSQVLMVGDSTHDLISGRDAGMGTVAVLTGMAEAHELAPFADVVLKNIGDLPAYLGQ